MKAALKQALAAMRGVLRVADRATEEFDALRSAIRAAESSLAESEQEPVAWRTFDGEGGYDYRDYEDNESYRDEWIKRNGDKYATWVQPLYTSPVRAEPMMDEEIDEIYNEFTSVRGNPWYRDFARAVERKVRGKA